MAHPSLSPAELRQCVAKLPRLDLAHLPTPLEEVPRFAERIGGGVRIFIKRDDCTGFYFGGNKTRHNEFLLAEALRQEADLVVWGAGVQSNNCRQTSAACAKLGLECRLYLSRGSHGEEVQGNLLLDHLAGAKVEIIDAPVGPELDDLLTAKAEMFRKEGRRVFAWDRGTGRPLAAVSYTVCLAEVVEQLEGHKIHPSAIYVAAAGATGAGLALGKKLLGMKAKVQLVLPICWPWNVPDDLAEVANRSAQLLELPHRLEPGDIHATDAYVGPGYGLVTPEGMEALNLLARSEGIILDPVYTAKAMAALVADVRQGRIPVGESVVFVHTGGTPAIFAYRDEMMEYRKDH